MSGDIERTDVDTLLERRLGRRELLGLGAALGGATLLAGPGASVAAVRLRLGGQPPLSTEPGNLKVFEYAGYENPHLWQGYHGRFPLDKPSFTFMASDDDGTAKVIAGFRADVGHPCHPVLKNWVDLGVIQPWDTSLIKNFGDLNPRFVKASQVDGKQYHIPLDWGYISALYRADKVQPREPSWMLMFDDRYKGKIAWYDSPQDMVEIAAYALGMHDPFNLSDTDLNTVKKFLISKKRLARTIWTDQTTMEADFAAGNIWISYAWASSWVRMTQRGLKVVYLKPKEGRLAFLCGLVLFKNTKNYHRAHVYADAWASPQAGLWLINNFAYGHSNTKIDLKEVKPQLLVKAFSLDQPSIIREPLVHLEQYLRRRQLYGKVWDEVKAA